jgi:hypothetical protein
MAKKMTPSQVVKWCKDNGLLVDLDDHSIDILIPSGRRWANTPNDICHVYVAEWLSAEEKSEIFEDLSWWIADGLEVCDCEQCS